VCGCVPESGGRRVITVPAKLAFGDEGARFNATVRNSRPHSFRETDTIYQYCKHRYYHKIHIVCVFMK
jgi:hypothetical protein